MKYRVVICHSKRSRESVGTVPIIEQAIKAAIGYSKTEKKPVIVEILETETDEHRFFQNKIAFEIKP